MNETGVIVTNTGPLIALATVRQLGLLGRLYGSVLVPEQLRVKGAAGILVAAKRNRLISAIAPLLAGMKTAGYYLASNVIERALQEAGEQP